MAFEVLVRVPSNRIVWKPVEGCINHAEAREQGAAQYAGEVLQSRYNGPDNVDTSDGQTYVDAGGSWGLIILGGGLIIVVTLWPLIVAGGVIYISTVLYKWWKNRETN